MTAPNNTTTSQTHHDPDQDQLAQAAIEPITEGMAVALGTGRAASRAIHALAQRNKRTPLNIRCIPTSEASRQLAHQLALPLTTLEHTSSIDYLFDGADEVDPLLQMIKGRGGAMTREKVLANAAKQRTYLIDESKLVQRLGTRCPLPVEVLPFARPAIHRALEGIGFNSTLRTDDHNDPIITDNHANILDLTLPEPLPDALDLPAIDRLLNNSTGIIGHGLFLIEADTLIIESNTKPLHTRQRH